MKKIFLFVFIIGFSTIAKADWLDVFNAVVDNTVKTTNAVLDATLDDDYSQSSQKNYRVLRTLSAVRFNDYGKATGSIQLVETNSGAIKVLKNGQLYNYYKNSSYDSYSSNSNSPSYYEYYVDLSGRYYFNM